MLWAHIFVYVPLGNWGKRVMSLSCFCVGPKCFSPCCPECHDHHKVCDLQVQNAAPPAAPGQVNGQAVAVLLANDKAAFYGCGFYGGQDTLFDYSGRHYFKDCYFEGNIDIISGNGQSVFKVQPYIIIPLPFREFRGVTPNIIDIIDPYSWSYNHRVATREGVMCDTCCC